MPAAAAPIPLLYEDAALVIVDKPAGLAVAPGSGWSAETCVQGRVAGQLGRRLWVVHRLDRDTSGALAFAGSAPAHRALSLAFEHRDVHKAYRALVAGVPVPAAGVIDLPLHQGRRGKTRPATADEAGAREASTAYRVLSVWRGHGQACSLVEALPHTGRHHQIRVHLRAIGTPVLGDGLYGRGQSLAIAGPEASLALHASRLDVPHPAEPRRVVAEAVWPPRLATFTEWLDAHWTKEPAS
jgi:tRNA pseudouridine32 synthase / 23S rRNA pseudouridine746 synthase